MRYAVFLISWIAGKAALLSYYVKILNYKASANYDNLYYACLILCVFQQVVGFRSAVPFKCCMLIWISRCSQDSSLYTHIIKKYHLIQHVADTHNPGFSADKPA